MLYRVIQPGPPALCRMQRFISMLVMQGQRKMRTNGTMTRQNWQTKYSMHML